MSENDVDGPVPEEGPVENSPEQTDPAFIGSQPRPVNHYRIKILNARSRYKIAKLEVQSCKDDLKEAKATLESRLNELMDLIDNDPDAAPNLFNQPADSYDIDGGVAEPRKIEMTPKEWRAVELADIEGLTSAVLKSLAAARIHALGQLTDFSKDGASLCMVKGIGEAKEAEIGEATARWWLTHTEVPESGEAAA